MTAKVKSAIHILFKSFGYLIKKYTIANDQMLLIYKLLKDYNIGLIVDVGASRGQFAQQILKNGFAGKIISIEPLSDAYSILKKNASGYKNWQIAERCAIGDTEGEVTINVSENSVSSSVIEPSSLLNDITPGTKSVKTEKVKITKLDFLLENYSIGSTPALIKIDTQGYEDKVIKGGTNTLKQCRILIMEISFAELYRGQLLFIDMVNLAASHGFTLWSIDPFYTDQKTGRLLQADAVFIKIPEEH